MTQQVSTNRISVINLFEILTVKGGKRTSAYRGADASRAYVAYCSAFIEMLTSGEVDTLECFINGEKIDNYFDLLLQDVYGASS